MLYSTLYHQVHNLSLASYNKRYLMWQSCTLHYIIVTVAAVCCVYLQCVSILQCLTFSNLTTLLEPPTLNITTQLHSQGLASINQTKQVQETPRVTQSVRGSRKYDSCVADALTTQLYLSFDCHLHEMPYIIIVKFNVFFESLTKINEVLFCNNVFLTPHIIVK